MTKKILFFINGLGLGNSTRCHAVIQQLKAAGDHIAVVTSGNGLWYFENCEDIDELHQIQAFHYGEKNNKISILRTIKQLVSYRKTLRKNSQVISDVIQHFKPDVVIADSVYSFKVVKKHNIPFIALNNSDIVNALYKHYPDRPSSIRAQFNVIEKTDYMFHKFVPKLVISPNLNPSIRHLSDKFKRVGPIVRQGYEKDKVYNKQPQHIVIMLSGSRFGTKIQFNQPSYPFSIDIVGIEAAKGAKIPQNVCYHGKLHDNLALLKAADLVVVNGGFSAVSEIFYMRKPLIVVPVPRHAEQWINAKVIEDLGVGVMSSEEAIEQTILSIVPKLAQYQAAYEKIGTIPNGAQQAADIIHAF